MNRREAVRLLAGIAGVPVLSGLSPEQLLAFGRMVHRRTRRQALWVLDPHQDATVTAIAELIIPATDTPGAAAARVNQFIDLIVAERYDPDERARFLEGLADVDRRVTARFGATFVEATPEQQTALLRELDAEVAALREAGGEAERHVFHQIKWLTLYGYYTSEVGVVQELEYVIIPGRYDPCIATGLRGAGGRGS